jgi:hypothetical protein
MLNCEGPEKIPGSSGVVVDKLLERLPYIGPRSFTYDLDSMKKSGWLNCNSNYRQEVVGIDCIRSRQFTPAAY